MADLYLYGTAVHLYKPMVKRGVVDFAVGADWTPAAGDVKISIDGGTAANVTNLPVAITMGNTAMWDYSLTSGEITGKKIRVTIADSVTKAVEDQFFEIDTYGNAGAQHALNLNNANVLANVMAINSDTLSATNLYRIMNGAVVGTVTTAGLSPTTTQFECSDITEATTGHFTGRQCVVASGTLKGETLGYVTAYSLVSGRGRFTVSPGSPTSEALASTDVVVFV